MKSLVMLNKALLGKWSWRFANEKETFWNQVIKGKYGEECGGWCFQKVRERYSVRLWKAIRKLEHLVSSRFSLVVRNGQRVSFWKDKWRRVAPLCDSFPTLFAIAISNDMELYYATKSKLLCFRSVLGKSSNFGPSSKEGGL